MQNAARSQSGIWKYLRNANRLKNNLGVGRFIIFPLSTVIALAFEKSFLRLISREGVINFTRFLFVTLVG